MQEVQFPDVSFYQKEVDYSIMSTKTEAIIVRAGQNLWIDEQFGRNYSEAKRYGLKVGAYWFYDGRVSPQTQAATLISLLQGRRLELELFIDWEKNYGGAHEGLHNVVAMMELVEQAGLDIKGVGQYTGYYFFRANSNAITNASQYSYLKNKPLWLAWYTLNPGNVLIPAPWTQLTHWQFGTPAVQWGQQTLELDMNFFNGTKAEFDKAYGATAMRVIKGTAKTTVNRRIIPGGSLFNPPRYLYPGDEIEATENDFQWLHLSKINGVPVNDMEWASAGTTQLYITWQWVDVVVEPPPPPPPDPTITHTIDVYSDGKVSIDGGTPY